MSTDPAHLPATWASGSVVDAHFVGLDGSTSGIHPMTVISDDGALLLGWVPVATPIRRAVLADGREIRSVGLQERFRLPRKLIDSTWTGTSTLRLIDETHWSSVWWFFDAETGSFRGWYVNLEVPLGRTDSAVVRSDGVLDIQVDPDHSWRWKDEDEFAAARDAGRITAHEAVHLRAEGKRMGELATAQAFPFDGTHTDFTTARS